jgi:hypothetical protein
MTWGIFKKDSVSEAYAKMKSEELKGKQHKLDVNKNGKVDGDDLAKLRSTKEEVENVEEGWDDMLKYVKDKNGPQPNGGSGKKQGTRYGGQKQKEDESDKRKEQNEELDVFSDKEIDMLINEVLSKDASAGEWISDFVKSDNPKFAGKSKEQRKKQALGAYYAAQRNESTDYESFLVLDEATQDDIVKMGAKEIKHANMKDKQNDQEVMEPHSGTEAKFIDSHSIRVEDDPTQGKFDSGTGKTGKASEPKGKGPGSYDAKEKLGDQKTGVKEEVYKTGAGEEIDTEPAEKKAGDKKKFGSFKASMNKEASDCKSKQ